MPRVSTTSWFKPKDPKALQLFIRQHCKFCEMEHSKDRDNAVRLFSRHSHVCSDFYSSVPGAKDNLKFEDWLRSLVSEDEWGIGYTMLEYSDDGKYVGVAKTSIPLVGEPAVSAIESN